MTAKEIMGSIRGKTVKGVKQTKTTVSFLFDDGTELTVWLTNEEGWVSWQDENGYGLDVHINDPTDHWEM